MASFCLVIERLIERANYERGDTVSSDLLALASRHIVPGRKASLSRLRVQPRHVCGATVAASASSACVYFSVSRYP